MQKRLPSFKEEMTKKTFEHMQKEIEDDRIMKK